LFKILYKNSVGRGEDAPEKDWRNEKENLPESAFLNLLEYLMPDH
jgi:hypothetical protein